MTLPARAASRGVSAERWQGALLRFVQDSATVVDMEVRKLRHDPLELLSRAVQPVLWLLIFGKVMAQTRDPHRRPALPGFPGPRDSCPKRSVRVGQDT